MTCPMSPSAAAVRVEHGPDARHRSIDLAHRLLVGADEIGSFRAHLVELLREARAVEPERLGFALDRLAAAELILLDRESRLELPQSRFEPIECMIELACIHQGPTAFAGSRISQGNTALH